MTELLLFLVLALLVAIEVPVGFALAASAFCYLLITHAAPLGLVVQRMAPGLDSFPLLAIPLFIFAGNLLNTGGISARIFDFAQALVGHIRGSLAHVNVVASLIFSGMSGVAQADAAGLGTIEIREMKRAGFGGAFSAAVTAASAVIGPIVPPSVIMVIYAVIAQVSVADLFLAGIVPGLIIGMLLLTTIYVLAVTGRVHAPVRPRASLPDLGRAFRRALPALAAPALLTSGLLIGFATPTELGAITCVYAIGLGFATRELRLMDIFRCARDTAITTGVLVFIIAAAVPFGWIVAVSGLPSELAAAVQSISNNPWVVLGILNLGLLAAGLIMETTAVLLIATPALLPLIQAAGIDPVHFGLVIVINLLIGAVTPPFGVLLFIVMDIARVTFREMLKAMLPFYIPLGIALLLVTYWPDLVLALPRFVAGLQLGD